MGKARNRGNYQDRKDQAILDGRIKQKPVKYVHTPIDPIMALLIPAIIRRKSGS